MDSTKLDSPLLPSSNCVTCGKMLRHVTSCSCHVVSEKLLSAIESLPSAAMCGQGADRLGISTRFYRGLPLHSEEGLGVGLGVRINRRIPKDTEGHGFRILKDAISDVI